MTNFTQKTVVDLYLRIIFLSLLLFWCLSLIFPFLSIVVWSIILAMAMAPLYNTLLPKFKNKKGATATFLILIGLLIILVPSWLFLDSIIDGITEMKDRFIAGTLTIPPPTESVADLPLIGKKLYQSWLSASENLQSFLVKYKDVITEYGKSFVSGILGIGGSVLQFAVSTIIAGVLLATTGTKSAADKIFIRIIGPQGEKFSELAQRTVNNVVKGVLGVALIQGFILGIGFLLAGVPYAGIWALVVFVLAILQLPATLVVIPVAIWLFGNQETLPAILWTVFLLLGGLSDNFLKPILLGKGAPVPMLVIFLGVVGGFITMGFIGLFIGAIILSLGYLLLTTWMNDTTDSTQEVTEQDS